MAFIADKENGLIILPIPVEIKPVVVNSEDKISLAIPSPRIPGNYTLRVFDDHEYYELPGAVTFAKTLVNSKAIIVAGGGPYTGNFLWKDTLTCANYAFNALLYQGYKRENIYYLCAQNVDADGDGKLNDVDGDASFDNLSYALNTWVNADENPADELLIYITDHGGNGTFKLNNSSKGILKADVLDSWLDTLQSKLPGNLIFINDACFSGSFLPLLKPPAQKKRIIISSTIHDERSTSFKRGKHTFSYQFWAAVFGGGELRESFYFGKDMMEDFQTAMLDADGDGIGNTKSDKTKSNHIIIGRGYKPQSDIPAINTASVNNVADMLSLNGTGSVTIRAGDINDLNGISEVWAVVTPPAYDGISSGTPVMNLPSVMLEDPDKNGVYEGVFNDFPLQGTYKISIYARNTKGFYSLPRQLAVNQTFGAIFVDFTVSATRGPAALTVSFQGTSASQITNWLWNFGDGESGSGQSPVHTYISTGTYTVSLTATGQEGSDTRTRTDFITVIPVSISGRAAVSSIAGHESLGVKNATVTLEGTNLSAETDSNGHFILEIPDTIQDGNYELVISSSDMINITQPVTITAGQSLELGNVSMIVEGSEYTQEQLNQIIKEAVMEEIQKWDVNSDNRFGLEEVIYGLQVVSGIKGK